MELLKVVLVKGGNLSGAKVLKGGSFLNHKRDPKLFLSMGKEFARRFAYAGVTKILTVEASGIAVAVMAGLEMNVPVVFAKKKLPSTFVEGVYTAEVYSFTKQEKVSVCVSERYLAKEDRVLILDDFLAMGAASQGMVAVVRQSGATLVGVGIVIEKAFQPGGQQLRDEGIRVESLARISAFENGQIKFT